MRILMAEQTPEQPRQDSPPPRKRSRLLRALRRLLLILGIVAFAITMLWCVAALAIDVRVSWLRMPLAIAFAIGALAALIFLRPRKLAIGICLAAFLIVLAWWLSLRPTNDRQWEPDVAILPYADIKGDLVTIHNIRNFNYRSETDYDIRYYDRTVDLSKLDSVDLYVVYWGSPSIAHTMLSFGFAGGDPLCISIETRKPLGLSYSTVLGFFRQFGLIYIVGDERDLVKLRSNYRHEDVYLYHLASTPDVERGVFIGYINEINSLHDKPEWYNVITSNCTTNIRGHTLPYAKNRHWDWRLLLTGYVDEFAYDRGGLCRTMPFAELKQRSHINEKANAAGDSDDFSRLIREGLPKP